MSDRLGFEIRFHGPFLVASGDASTGLDTSGNHDNPLPATSIKGVMRDSLEETLGGLGLPGDAVASVFGGPALESRWSWTDARLTSAHWKERARVRIDPETGAADPGGLRLGEELWTDGASFDVIRARHSNSPLSVEMEKALIVVAGHGVKALGSSRRRGCGWVSVHHTGDPTVESALDLLLDPDVGLLATLGQEAS